MRTILPMTVVAAMLLSTPRCCRSRETRWNEWTRRASRHPAILTIPVSR